jgi:hypothetical protein
VTADQYEIEHLRARMHFYFTGGILSTE